MSSFFHRIVGCFWREYFKRLRAITFGFGARLHSISWSGDGHEIGKGSAWGKDAIELLPFENLLHKVIDFKFHEGKTGCELICVDGAVDGGSHHGAKDGVLIEASKELIVEMGMVGFGLFVEDFVEQGKQIIIVACIFLNLEVNLLFQLFRLGNLDDFILAMKGLLDELKREVESSLHEVSLIVGKC